MQQLNDIHSTPIQSAALLFSLEHPIQNVALILAVITSHTPMASQVQPNSLPCKYNRMMLLEVTVSD